MQERPQHLVLEDGTVFPGTLVGAAGRRRGRGLLHDRDGRLRGGGHRPELRRAGALLRLPADRQLRRRRGAASSPSACRRGRRHARRAARVGRRGCASRASSRSTTSTRARSCGGSATTASCAARSATAPVEELHARALAEPPIDGRPLDRHVGTRRAVLGRRRPARRRSSTSAASARSRAGSPRPGLEVARRPGRLGRRRDPRAEPRAVLIGNGPGDPAVLDGPIETVRDLLGARAALRHLPRPPAARARARPRDVQAAVRPPRREPSRARRCAPAACSSPSRTTASRSRADDDSSATSR